MINRLHTDYVRTLAHSVEARQQMGVRMAILEIYCFGAPYRIKVQNASEKTVDDIRKAFGRLETTLNVVVAAYDYVLFQEIYLLNDRLKEANLLRHGIKKEMTAVYSAIDEFDVFEHQNMREKYDAWDTLLSEVHPKVYNEVKLLRIHNRQLLLNKGKEKHIDVAAQMMLVFELATLAKMKFGLKIDAIKKEQKCDFDADMYARKYRPEKLFKALENLQSLLALDKDIDVSEDANIRETMKAVIRKLDDADNYEQAARIAIEEDKVGVFTEEERKKVGIA